jgi:hypothetical protein
MEFSRCAWTESSMSKLREQALCAEPTDLKTRLSGGLSKLNSVNAELDVIPGEPADRTTS